MYGRLVFGKLLLGITDITNNMIAHKMLNRNLAIKDIIYDNEA